MRQKGIGYHKKGYLNFILTVRALMKANTADKKGKILARLHSYERVADREWLEGICKV